MPYSFELSRRGPIGAVAENATCYLKCGRPASFAALHTEAAPANDAAPSLTADDSSVVGVVEWRFGRVEVGQVFTVCRALVYDVKRERCCMFDGLVLRPTIYAQSDLIGSRV